MTAVSYLAAAGWLAVLGTVVPLICRHLPGHKPPLPRRTPADVRADVAAHRAAQDHATCEAIWNLDPAQPRKEQQ